MSAYKRDPLKQLSKRAPQIVQPVIEDGNTVADIEPTRGRDLERTIHRAQAMRAPGIVASTADMRRLILVRLPDAIERLFQVLESGSDRDSVAAARTILDYSLGKPRRVSLDNEQLLAMLVQVLSDHLPPDQLDTVRDAMALSLSSLTTQE